ncbi:putative proline-specific permease [Pseudomassariella vexata]|uniref:Putative proline-specific permease n=1 Tax=Pseudomassariella vexata TaxID=1141098 RepID=A0A1Y2E1B0_9PEZI|nr:putative proline-specific permease [Pseudomassariella vexata]ORY65126.1 putative proline-specific permease [Pseudomassariella vexata]
MSAFPKDEKGVEKRESDAGLERNTSVIIGETLGSNSDASTEAAATHTTQRGLKSRHAQMIALGGTIGTGLFVGAGQGLAMGGPLFLLLSYCCITLCLYGVATATGEISSYLPVPGASMLYYGNRFVSKSLGFTMGWVYWYIFAITVPAEITATTLVIQYWDPPLHTAVWLTIVGVLIILLNCLPVRFYGETEFWFASTKVIGIVGLLIMTVVLFFGGGPKHEPLYFKHWNNPGPVNEYLVEGAAGRLCAFIGTITFSVFAFAFAPELLVVTGGEMESPRRNLPVATKRYFYRLLVFYVLGALAIGILVPSNSPNLLSAGSGAAASPWAIGIRDAGIQALDTVVNVVIVLSAWSAGNSYLYLATRTMYSMALAGNAPKIFTRCTKKGVPYYATAASASFSLLAYLNVAASGATVFSWFVNIINTGGFQSWICCCIIYMRFRKATAAQGITDIPYRSRFQPYSGYVSIVAFTVMLLLSGFKVFFDGRWDAASFVSSYIGIPIFAALYFGHKLTVGRQDAWAIPVHQIDLSTGLEEILAAETPARPRDNWWQKWRVLIE